MLPVEEPWVRTPAMKPSVPALKPVVPQPKVRMVLQFWTTVQPEEVYCSHSYSAVPELQVPVAVKLTMVPAVWGEVGLALTETAEQGTGAGVGVGVGAAVRV